MVMVPLTFHLHIIVAVVQRGMFKNIAMALSCLV